MKKLLTVFALTIGFATAANADLLVEPYLGYEKGSFKDSLDDNTSFTNLGLRLAYKAPVMFWVGLDATMSMSGSIDGLGDPDAKRTTYYGVAGIDLPILLRGWIGYAISSEIKMESPVSDTVKGKGMKVGLGTTFLPFVSLNLEYLKDTFDEGAGLTEDENHESYMLSVSLPLEF